MPILPPPRPRHVAAALREGDRVALAALVAALLDADGRAGPAARAIGLAGYSSLRAIALRSADVRVLLSIFGRRRGRVGARGKYFRRRVDLG